MEWLGDLLYVWLHPKYEWLWGVVVPVTLGAFGLLVALFATAIEWVRERLRS